jgi:hypothetical protein
MRRFSISLLNKIENDVNRWHDPWADQGCLGNLASGYPSVPKPASADDLFQAAALIWAPRDAISRVHVPFLEPLPLGPQNAFIPA